MSALTITDCGKRQAVWHAWVCVLLMVLILYNPFLALTSATSGLAYQNLARHRASVGASELQHYAPVQVENAQPDANVDLFMEDLAAAHDGAVRLILERGHLPLLMEGMTSLWFRPPPRP